MKDKTTNKIPEDNLKGKDNVLAYSHGSSANPVPKSVGEVKDKRADKNKEYKRFGSDNLYVQALASLYRQSITLRGIINSKVIYTSAGGFILEEESGPATDFINSPNESMDSLTDLFEKYLVDRYMSGNAYLEIIKNSDNSVVNIGHIQTVKVRLHKSLDSVLVHPDWARYESTKEDAVRIALWPNFTEVDGLQRSVIHIKDYEPDFDFYGIPTYIAALDAAGIGYKTNKWNISRLDNSFQTSGVLLISGDMDDDDAQDLSDTIVEEMTGEDNQGKLTVIVKKLGAEGAGTEFTPINENHEGDWTQLHSQSNDDLIIANNWKKSLAGITENSGFDVDRILNDYQVARSTFLIKEQKKFIDIVSRVMLELQNLDLAGLAIVNKPPISLLTKLNADKFTFKWEARAEAGLDFDAEDPVQQGYVDSTSTTTESTTASALKTMSKSLNWIKEKLL